MRDHFVAHAAKALVALVIEQPRRYVRGVKRANLYMVFGLWIAGGCGEGAGPNAASPDPGRMRIVISGAIQHEAEWQAFGEFDDMMAAYVSEASYLTGQNDDRSGGDSTLALFLPTRLQAGRLGIRQYATEAVVNVILELGGRSFVSIDGWFDVQAADYPPRPGLDPGLGQSSPLARPIQRALLSRRFPARPLHGRDIDHHPIRPTHRRVLRRDSRHPGVPPSLVVERYDRQCR